jgi:hypothetical protein
MATRRNLEEEIENPKSTEQDKDVDESKEYKD